MGQSHVGAMSGGLVPLTLCMQGKQQPCECQGWFSRHWMDVPEKNVASSAAQERLHREWGVAGSGETHTVPTH